MSQRYLLKCPQCDAGIEIETTQAGQQIQCPSCSSLTKIGTLREIRQLDVIVEESPIASRSSAWTPLKRWLFVVGILLFVIGAAVGFYSWSNGKKLESSVPKPDTTLDAPTANAIDLLSPADMAKTWDAVSESDIAEWNEHPHISTRRRANESLITAYVFFAIAAAGLIMLASALVIKGNA